MTSTCTFQKDFISIKEASKLSGIQAQTLRKLGDEGKIRIYRTVSGQRKFHRESLEKMCYNETAGGAGAVALSSNAATYKTGEDMSAAVSEMEDKFAAMFKKQNFIYCRVSSRGLTSEFEKQKNAIFKAFESKAAASADGTWNNISMDDFNSYKIIKDVSSGTNFKRKGMDLILKACFNKTIGDVVILKKSRLTLFGYEFIEDIVKLGGGRIIVVNENDRDNQLHNQELLGELIHILQKTKTDLTTERDDYMDIVTDDAGADEVEECDL
jgi:excisionase family DNA binding protein